MELRVVYGDRDPEVIACVYFSQDMVDHLRKGATFELSAIMHPHATTQIVALKLVQSKLVERHSFKDGRTDL